MPDHLHFVALEKDLTALSRDIQPTWMIWQGKPGPIPVKKLKALDIDSLVFDSCANAPWQGDFLSVMRRNVENLKPAFE